MRSLRRCEALREFSEYKHFHTSALGQAPVWALLLRNAVWPGMSGKDLGRSGQTLSCSHMFFKGLKRETIPISLNWHAEFPHILPKPLSVKIDFRAHIWHSRTASSLVLRCGLMAVGDHKPFAFIFKWLISENLTWQVKTMKDGVFWASPFFFVSSTSPEVPYVCAASQTMSPCGHTSLRACLIWHRYRMWHENC